jgi:hypothetical protein
MKYSGLLSDAVDDGLSKLGQLPKKAIYDALETDFSMRKKDIPTRFTEFSSILLGNIGPSARPLLEYIVDRFSSSLRTKSLSSIDLDESVKRVDMILKGGIDLPDEINHSSRAGSVQSKCKAAKTIDDSSLPRIPRPEIARATKSGISRPSNQDTCKRKSGRTGTRSQAKANS